MPSTNLQFYIYYIYIIPIHQSLILHTLGNTGVLWAGLTYIMTSYTCKVGSPGNTSIKFSSSIHHGILLEGRHTGGRYL